MAKIASNLMVLKLSKLVKNNEEDDLEIPTELEEAIVQSIQNLTEELNLNIMVELEDISDDD